MWDSLTGGGSLTNQSSASADGDNSFSNGFNYRNGSQSSNNQLMTVAIIGLIAYVALKGRK